MGSNIKKIGSNTFNKTAKKLKEFFCFSCGLEYQPPNYRLKTLLNQMTQLEVLTIGVNDTEMPTNAIEPDGNQTKLNRLTILNNYQNLTIKSKAFQLLNQLHEISIWDA